jgi:hypothetical protein
MPIGNPNGYGSIVLNQKGGVMSPNDKRPGQRFISTANARAQMTPAAMRRAQTSAVSGIRANYPTGSYNRSGPSPTPVRMSPTRNRPAVGNNAKKGIGAIKNKGKIAMGIGAAVVGGLAYSGRRGEGSSGGRTGMTRY